MPPKANKGEKGKKKKKQTQIPLDDIDTTFLNMQQLQEFCVRTYDELIREKQYSEFLTLDRNKIATMTEIATERLKALAKNNWHIKEDLRESKEKHRVLMAGNRQKLLYLRSELVGERNQEKENALNTVEDEHKCNKEMEHAIHADINNMKQQLVQLNNLLISDTIKLQTEHAENVHSTREKNKKQQILFERKHEFDLHETVNKLQLMFSEKCKTLENYKETECNRFIKKNKKQTMELEHYYKKILYHNLGIMSLLKNKIQETKDEISKIEVSYFKLKSDEQRLNRELEDCILTIAELKNKMFEFNKDKKELARVKRTLKQSKEELHDLTVNNDILIMASEILKAEQNKRDEEEIKEMLIMNRKVQGVVLVLEYVAFHISNRLREIDVHLTKMKEICLKAGIHNSIFDSICHCEDTSLDAMNYQITFVGEESQSLLQSYKEKLKKFNIHFDNTGFTPLRIDEVLKKINHPRMMVNEEGMSLFFDFDKMKVYPAKPLDLIL